MSKKNSATTTVITLNDVVTDFRNAITKVASELEVTTRVDEMDHRTMLALAVKGFKSYVSQKRSTQKQLAKKKVERKEQIAASPAESRITSAVVSVRI